MSAVLNWFKKQIEYLKDSLPELFMATIFFFLTFSGVLSAILLRYLGNNGIVITFYSLIVQGVALVFCYFLFRKYLISDDKSDANQKRSKKSFK
ncbi:MAG: hypothetical protein EU550_03820 [Promethearchaeota archaeon]|nr:MAG: hypothetical protein EU550_03820 [Candidatus Lokiarchaeota archaeon]